jgi:hypothetical protein
MSHVVGYPILIIVMDIEDEERGIPTIRAGGIIGHRGVLGVFTHSYSSLVCGLVCLMDCPETFEELGVEPFAGAPSKEFFFGGFFEEVGHHVPLNEGTDEESISAIEQLGIVRGEPHITTDVIVGIEVGIRGRLTLHVSEGLDVRLTDIVMVCGGYCIHITNCDISCGSHMLADGEGVVRVIVLDRPRIEVLFPHIIETTALNDEDFVPSLVVERSLELTYHAFDNFLGDFAVAGELASLAFRDAAGHETALKIANELVANAFN